MERDSFNIIIADDDVDDQLICSEALHSTGYKCSVTFVKNGKLLLDFMQKNTGRLAIRPDCLVLDINMPVMDGLQALEHLIDKNSLKGLPVFMLTTSNKPDHRVRASELGARGYYSKPVTLQEYQSIFREILHSL